MKPNVYHRISLLIALAVISFGNLLAQKAERSINRNFTYTEGKNLNIDSKFGNINVLESEDKTISIVAEIWVTSDNQNLARELADELNVSIAENGNDINVSSVFPAKLPSRDNTKFGINYTIHVPPQINANINNKYGSVYIENISGLAKVEVSYGTLKAQTLSHGKENQLNEVILNYCNGSTISEAGWLKVNLSYSKLSISEARAIVALTKYSGLNLDECSSLVAESKYDTYKIGEMKNYVGDLKYSNLSAGEIADKFEISSSYSNVKVGAIGKDFKSIKIDNSRGNYRLSVSQGSSFTIKGEAIRGDIAVDGIENLSQRIENADKYISGQYGSNPRGKVEISVKEGKVRLSID